jgi:ribonuclease J
MRLTIHRGTNEIGGNCVEVCSSSTRIILDVGMPLFGANREPFDDRTIRGKSSEELLEAGILPKVEGLFAEGPAPKAIFLSHAHMDHTGFLPHTRPEIPVYATTGTSKMMSAGGIFANQVEIPRERHKKLIPGKTRRIGNLRVTTFAVDHSVFGSSAFLVEGGGKTILYSGDLRLHGRKTGMAKAMLAALKGKTIDVLLMEGTHLGGNRAKGPSEYDLEKEIATHVASSKSLVLASFSPQHVDRLVGFIKASQRTHRTFVADVYTAYVLHLIETETKTPPPIKSEGIQVFYPKYFLSSFERKNLQKIHGMFQEDAISLDQIRSDPAKCLMVFRPSMLESDFNWQLPPGALCLYSRWEGYLDQPEWQETEKRLKAVGGNRKTLHTSGHIQEDDIARFVDEVAPRAVIPMHTFEPERLGDLCERVHRLENGQQYEVV